MSKKSEAKKAALVAAQKAAVLPMLLGLTVVLECAWTEEGTGEYPALHLDPRQKKRVTDKWRQIVRWRDAVCDQQEYIRESIRRNVLHRELQSKWSKLERCIKEHCDSGRVTYNLALVVETIAVSAMLVDWFEEHGRISTNQFAWFIQSLNTFAGWVCKAGDPAVLLANIVYYEMRDLFLEKPNWTKMYVNKPLTESTAWAYAHPHSEFGKAAKAILKKYYPEENDERDQAGYTA